MSPNMRDFAKQPEEERRAVFRAAGESMKVHESIIEKDFWVCWVLDYLFQDSPWKSQLIFKGGTSLSKAYGAIQRFSEDVDLIIDWALLGFTETEAFTSRSGKQQDKFRKETDRRLEACLKNEFSPELASVLPVRSGHTMKVTPSEGKLLIEYPRAFPTKAIRPEILLEIGPKALQEPNEQREIRSYSAEKSPGVFSMPTTRVRTVSAERTFWEKATILHREYYKAPVTDLDRYSRHYYDLYRLSQTEIREKALKRLDLLAGVVHFKMKFYRCKWAKYEEAKPGTLRLQPPQHNLSVLKSDYSSMQEMIFGPSPTFEEILAGLESLENEINRK
jgi:hypothetical protein